MIMKNSPNKTNNSPPPPIENPVMQLTSSMAFIGPLPPPEAFEKYERTHAGAADRIIKMAENEANHRRELEKKALVHNIWVAHLSQFFAFILSITGLKRGRVLYCK